VARPKFNFAVLDPGSGRAQPGAWVSVYLANTLTLATLYADDDVSTLANPVQANQLGQVAMRVNPGVYDVSMSWDGAQPTIVEDVLAWTPEGAVLTTPGDLLVGTAAGPKALHVGLENQLLVVDQGLPVWRTLASNDGVPTGPTGSLLVYGTAGGVQVILPGTQDQALAMAGGTPTWVSTLLPSGTTLPINQPGDLVVGAPGTGLPARLAVGALGSTLMVSDNSTLVWSAPGAAGGAGPGAGQCYLAFENSTSLWLTPFAGNKLWVNGQSRTIPDAGIRLAPTGLSANTNYYIYVAWTGSALQLEASTTGMVQTGGLWHKAGDPSRTLVGYARCVGDATWHDFPTSRCVLSLFNQDERIGEAAMAAPRSTTSTSPVLIDAETVCYFIAWGFTNITMFMTGTAHCNVSGAGFVSHLFLDGVSIAGAQSTPLLANTATNITTVISKTLPAQDTLHSLALYGAAQPGVTATWYGEASRLMSCRTGYTIAT
jgi:hypothetical protein